jgi:hypothetical protein
MRRKIRFILTGMMQVETEVSGPRRRFLVNGELKLRKGHII